MKLGFPSEQEHGERRVAVTPETVKRYCGKQVDVLIERGAGRGAFISDDQYAVAGAEIVPEPGALREQADVLVSIHPPNDEAIEALSGKTVAALLDPLRQLERIRALADGGVISLSLDLIPRITRAQSMDVLSSMSTLAGYKAALLGANALPRITPMMMTAAGTLRPAQALVIGAGVAGLQAIATAKRIGAVVTAVDVRPAVGEQVESLGAKFVAMEVEHAEDAGGYATDLGEEFYRQEQEILAPHVQRSDLVVTTALIPGRPAPVLITGEMVKGMRPGTVIVDLAAAGGGNCTLSKPDETVEAGGVTVLAPTDLPARMPVHASTMLARNVSSYLFELVDEEGRFSLDMDNEVVAGTLVTRDGEVVHPKVLNALGEGEVPA